MATETYSDPGGTGRRSESTTDQAKHAASDAVGEAKQKAEHLAEQAKSQVKTQLAGQKDQATEQLESISSALRSTSENLRDENQDAVAGYIGDAARQVDRLSGYLRNHTAGELLEEAERYARREPALFLGGAMLLGLVGARFFKSSSPDRGYDRSYDRGYDRRFAREYDRGYDGDSYATREARSYSNRPYNGPSYGSRDTASYRSYESRSEDFTRPRRTTGTTSSDYPTVQDTAGARMPDTTRDTGRDTGRTSSASTPSTSASQSTLGKSSDEGGRNA